MNLPLYLGITETDIKYLIDQYITSHYLKNQGNKNPILCVDINHSNNNIVVEFSSVEEANRVIKLEFMELIGVKCKVMRCSESMYGNQQNMVDRLKKIKEDGQAVGVAMKAMDTMLTGDNLVDNLNPIKNNFQCNQSFVTHIFISIYSYYIHWQLIKKYYMH